MFTPRRWSLRDALPSDAAALAALIRLAFEEYRGGLVPPSSAHAETPESVRRKLASAGAAVAVVEDGLVGCVFFEEQPARIYVSRLSVQPEYRGRGLGQELLEYAEARARLRGFCRICLGVRLALPRQQAYYAHRGYKAIGQMAHPGFAEPTYVVMEKEVQ